MFLGLGHVAEKNANLLAYSFLFYTFEPRPPFALLGFSELFRMPSLHSSDDDIPPTPPLVQYVAGMALSDGELLLSFGEKDCQGGVARIALERALSSVDRRPPPTQRGGYVESSELDFVVRGVSYSMYFGGSFLKVLYIVRHGLYIAPCSIYSTMVYI